MYLPQDNKSGSLIQALLAIYKGKLTLQDGGEKLFDKHVTQAIEERGIQIMTYIRVWLLSQSRLEIHVPFDSIP